MKKWLFILAGNLVFIAARAQYSGEIKIEKLHRLSAIGYQNSVFKKQV